ncbi:hypothetical protein, conserved [Eimeria tenella]|uniref:Major facilitator superfamily domain-containing protein n=1 Tax=Eimeria tenella TaxID=5802 RepID=U6KIU9_EIMTE|nr:hypothetical protein, conserved [Eimeria tenella]CDJ37950.1 hypothetical protein, conserved [Eimeria tenella]|eukprot:XP_013228788.1 hypothetical protein, conserved [Eimeria tenella]
MRILFVHFNIFSFRTLLLLFACAGLGSCFLLALFFIPYRPFPPLQQQQQQQQPQQQPQQQQQEEGAVGSVQVEVAAECAAGAKAAEKPAAAAAAAAAATPFLAELLRPTFLLMAAAYILMIFNLMFFVPSTQHLIPAAYAANQLLQVFSFLPCPLLGFAADKAGVLAVVHFLNCCCCLNYLFVLLPRIPTFPVLQYLAAVCCALQVSFMSSQLYCYGSRYFSQQNMGRLIGTTFCLAGLLSLLTNLMREYALKRSFAPMCLLAISLSLVAAVLISLLQCLDRRGALGPPRAATAAAAAKKAKQQQQQQQQLLELQRIETCSEPQRPTDAEETEVNKD